MFWSGFPVAVEHSSRGHLTDLALLLRHGGKFVRIIPTRGRPSRCSFHTSLPIIAANSQRALGLPKYEVKQFETEHRLALTGDSQRVLLAPCAFRWRISITFMGIQSTSMRSFLQASTASDLWVRDLDALGVVLDEIAEEVRQQELEDAKQRKIAGKRNVRCCKKLKQLGTFDGTRSEPLRSLPVEVIRWNYRWDGYALHS